jgi:hypothetical protein
MTPFNDETQKLKMKRFLSLQFKSLNTLVGKSIKEVEISNEDIMPQDKLDYKSDIEQSIIGFNYSPGDMERDYFFVICCWMSVMNGKQKDFNSIGSKPFLIYDGYEDYVLFVKEKGQGNFSWIEVDENGYRELPTLSGLNINKRLKKIVGKKYVKELELIDSLTKKELERLTTEWKNFI